MVVARVPRALKIVAIAIAAYFALMLLVALPALNIFVPKIYQQQTGRELRLDKLILLNPFTLAVSIRDASAANADGSRFWSFDLLRVNVSLASLWQRRLVLDEVALDGAALQITQPAPGRYNFSEILDFRAQHFPAGETTPDKNAQSGFGIAIRKLSITARHLGINAPHWSEPVALDLSNFGLTVAALEATTGDSATGAAIRSGPLDLRLQSIAVKLLRSETGFATQWRDLHIGAQQLSSAATTDQAFALTVLDANGGKLDIAGNIAAGAKRSSGRVALHDIDLLPAWHFLSPRLAFTAQSAALGGLLNYSIDWNAAPRYALDNSAIELRNVRLQAKNDAQTSVAFASLRAEGVQIDSAQPRAAIASIALREPAISGWNRDSTVSLAQMFALRSDAPETESPPWQIAIDAIESQGGALRWRASQLPDREWRLAPLSASVRNVRWPDGAPLQLQFQALLNETAKVAVQGELNPATLGGALNAEIAQLPLAWGNTLLQRQMQAVIAGGQLSATAQIALADGAPVSARSEGRIEALELQSTDGKRKLLAWKTLRWRELSADIGKRELRIRHVGIDEPWVQFRINPDGTNNFQQLLTTSGAQPESAAKNSVAETPPRNAARETAAAGGDWEVALDTVQLKQANIDFRDASLARAFRANITDLSGTITDLTTQPASRAKIALKGTVDGYAPVALSGTANLFAPAPTLNVALDITNLDLATLTPYSGTYAGYEIDSGRLSVQLVYTLENKIIKGTNHIVVNQLQLGDQVSGPKVIDLPLRFAIYLLTDSKGVMDLGVDVTGAVDDPDFSVGSIIWRAFRNLIVKTAASPFKALARLVGAGDRDDMDRVRFHPGADRIEAQESAKLEKLSAALAQKPELKLQLHGHVGPSQDIEGLRDNALSAQLIAQGGVDSEDIRQQSPDWQRGVAKLFRERFPERKNEPLQPMQMNDAMRDNIELPSNALQELAMRRALAVKQALIVEHGLAADRATVAPVDLGSDRNPGMQVTFELD